MKRRCWEDIRLIFATFAACVAFLQAEATEVVASRGDTFIFEAAPDREFSKSDFLAVSRTKGERALAYIPFEFDAPAVGISPERDKIITATLTLFIKKIPFVPDTNAIDKGKSDDDSGGGQESPDPAETAVRAADYLGEKAESADDNLIRIEVFGIVDDETFEPNTKNYRVSWDGKIDAVAPKHNTLDDKLDPAGIAKLGEIELDLSKQTFDDGDRIEFISDELTDFISFCYGSTIARGETPKFHTQLQKIRYAAIILRQESGPSGVFFYAADSYGDESGKVESGDEVKAKDKDNPTEGDGVEDAASASGAVEGKAESEGVPSQTWADAPSEAAQAYGAQGAASDARAANALATSAVAAGTSVAATSSVPAQAAARPNESPTPNVSVPIPSAAGSVRKTPALEAYSQELFLLKTQEESKPTVEGTEDIIEEKIEEKNESAEEKADYRPRIDFEFRSEPILKEAEE